MMTLHALLLILTGALAAHVMREDMRHLEISALPVFGLGGILILNGSIFPYKDLTAADALMGAALGLSVALATRLFIRWRTGSAGFGGADIVLIAGIGGLIGPYLVGPWLLFAATIGIGLSMLPVMRRTHELDDEVVIVIPFCPTLILSAGVVHLSVLAGLLPANPF